jgi:hypothetical protein
MSVVYWVFGLFSGMGKSSGYGQLLYIVVFDKDDTTNCADGSDGVKSPQEW